MPCLSHCPLMRVCLPPSGCTSMCLLRYYLREPAGFDVFCFRWNTLVSRSGSRPLAALVLAQFGAPLVQCATREVRFVVWNFWLATSKVDAACATWMHCRHLAKMGMNTCRPAAETEPRSLSTPFLTDPRIAWPPRGLAATPQPCGADRTRVCRAGCATLL
jgi:hypothetical protein